MDLDRYCSIPYDQDAYDCADLVIQVQRELFGRDVYLPSNRPRKAEGLIAIHKQVGDYGERTTNPVDGDLVLMTEMGKSYPSHVGVYFIVDFRPGVLHTTGKIGASMVSYISDLPALGLKIEGFYKWK